LDLQGRNWGCEPINFLKQKIKKKKKKKKQKKKEEIEEKSTFDC